MKQALLVLVLMLLPTTAWAFPDNGVLEPCTGADDTTPPSANMTNSIIYGASSANVEIGGNQCRSATGSTEADATWNTAFNAAQEAYLTIITKGGSLWQDVCGRLVNIGASTTDGYCVEAINGTTVDIYRVDNGAGTKLGASISQTIAVNDKVGIKLVGDQICAWFKSGAGAWTEIGCRTDATYSAGGKIGMVLVDGNATADDFGGGNVTVAATRPPIAPMLLN